MCQIPRFMAWFLVANVPLVVMGQSSGPRIQIDAASALKRDAVRVELELSEEQQALYEEYARERSRVIGSFLKSAQELPPELRQPLGAQLREQTEKIEKDIVSILRPEQKRRLDQLVLQIRVRADEPTAGLTHPYMVEELMLAPNQIELVKVKAEQIDAKLQARMKELLAEIQSVRKQARADVMQDLTEEQRRKYYELVGELSDAMKR